MDVLPSKGYALFRVYGLGFMVWGLAFQGLKGCRV